MKKLISLVIMAIAFITASYSQAIDSSKVVVNYEELDELGTVIPMNTQMFKDLVFDYNNGTTEWVYKGKKPAVIDFYADWCAPCIVIKPIMKSLAKKYKGDVLIYKIDTDKQKDLAIIMGIKSIPTLVFIPVYGKPQIMVGAASIKTYDKVIKKYLIKQKLL